MFNDGSSVAMMAAACQAMLFYVSHYLYPILKRLE